VILKVAAEDWKDIDFRRDTLRAARKEAADARKRIIIKTGDSKWGYRAVAIVDGRFYVGRVTRL
jgi:hypothetical protein